MRRSIAATLVAAVVLTSGGVVAWRTLAGPHPLKDQSFRTAVGERTTIELPDGSELTLNTDTVVRTRADRDRRLVYLERGQAFFQVAKDAKRPFIVAAGGKTVTALGTAFDVRLDASGVKVTLVEGRVRVEAPLAARLAPSTVRKAPGTEAVRVASVQAVDMTAGSQLLAPQQSAWQVASANVVVETSWTQGQLIFDNASLEAAVAELNRYSAKKIVIADPTIADTPISGVFRPGDVDSFVRTIQAYHLARGGENTREAVHLRAY